jgi:hypothetical protein
MRATLASLNGAGKKFPALTPSKKGINNMKKLTRFFATYVLVLAVSAVTFAGEIQTPGAPAPQPTPTPEEIHAQGLPGVDPSAAGMFDAVVESAELMATWFLNSF